MPLGAVNQAVDNVVMVLAEGIAQERFLKSAAVLATQLARSQNLGKNFFYRHLGAIALEFHIFE